MGQQNKETSFPIYSGAYKRNSKKRRRNGKRRKIGGLR